MSLPANGRPAQTSASYAPLDWSIGAGNPASYDGVMLQSGQAFRWNYEKEPRLHPGQGFVPQGHGVPLAFEATATQPPQQTLFYLGRNSTSLTNNSTFSTSTGFVALTNQQISELGYFRGGNG